MPSRERTVREAIGIGVFTVLVFFWISEVRESVLLLIVSPGFRSGNTVIIRRDQTGLALAC